MSEPAVGWVGAGLTHTPIPPLYAMNSLLKQREQVTMRDVPRAHNKPSGSFLDISQGWLVQAYA
jgi:hypothetical protein